MTLKIFNVAGQLVRRLEVGTMNAGSQAVRWDGNGVSGHATASGLYFCQLHLDGAQLGQTLKMNLVR